MNLPNQLPPEKLNPGPLEEILNRHRAFWLRAPTDRPLLGVFKENDYKPPAPMVLRDGRRISESIEITPGMLDLPANLELTRPGQLLSDDIICGWGPYDLCWTEAILGCRVFRAGPSAWSQPFLDDWSKVDALRSDGASPWLEELVELLHLIETKTQGRFPVCQPLLRGPLDMIEAAVPTEILYVGFYQNPDALHRLLAHCCDVFIATAQRLLAATPLFHDGHMARSEMGLWAPGTVIDFQGDAMRNLSREIYHDFVFEIDGRIAGAFDFSIIHTHSSSAHMIPVIIQEPELDAIQVTIDPIPYGPLLPDLLPAFEMIQKAGKALYIVGPMKRLDFDRMLETLSPAGLAIRAGILPDL